jgi:hypothetical protein
LESEISSSYSKSPLDGELLSVAFDSSTGAVFIEPIITDMVAELQREGYR